MNETQLAKFNEVARYLRVAHAHGHPKAGTILIDWLFTRVDQHYDGTATPWRVSREEEVSRVIAQMIDKRLPDGYLIQGGFAEQRWDLQRAVNEYRVAADLGSPQAQYKMADWLAGQSTKAHVVDIASRHTRALAMDLYRCAAQQDHGSSLTILAKKLLLQKAFVGGLSTMQRAVAAGSAEAAYIMTNVFSGQTQGLWPFRELVAKHDAARVDRYERIRMYLIERKEDRGMLPDLDRIVPLPPAPLPQWSGTFQLEREPGPEPGRPAEVLMVRLSREKSLDPTTGSPLRSQ